MSGGSQGAHGDFLPAAGEIGIGTIQPLASLLGARAVHCLAIPPHAVLAQVLLGGGPVHASLLDQPTCAERHPTGQQASVSLIESSRLLAGPILPPLGE